MKVLTVVQHDGAAVIDDPTAFIINISQTIKPGQYITIGCQEITQEQWDEATADKNKETNVSSDFERKTMGSGGNPKTEADLKSSKTVWPGEKTYN